MRRLLTGVLATLLVASFGFADTNKTGASNMNTTLQIQAQVNTAITFTLQNANGSNCLQNGTSTDYQITFGNVDGLGLENGQTGTCTSVTETNLTSPRGALYMAPYTYTVHYSGFTTTTGATVSAYSSNSSTAVQVYESTSATNGSALSQTAGTPTVISNNAATNTTSATRYIGLFVAETNGAGSIPGATGNTAQYTSTVTFVVAPN